MTETKIYCDHCDKELDSMHDYVDTHIDVVYEYFCADLCRDCVEALCNTIQSFLTRKTERGVI